MNKYFFAAILFFAVAATAVANAQTSAQNGTPAALEKAKSAVNNLQAAQEKKLDKIQNISDQEISNRITALNGLAARIAAMKKVSDAEKANISQTVKANITSLTALREKIKSSTDAKSAAADTKSITSAYRIYALVIPQGYILAAADKINSLAQTLSDLQLKLQTKVFGLSTNDTASLEKIKAAFEEMTKKIASTKTQAQKAHDAVASLVADNGDQTKAQANHSALVAARDYIKTASQDLNIVRNDAKSIVQALKRLQNPGQMQKSAQPAAAQ